MIWKDIPGFLGYQASYCGRLKAIRKKSWNRKTNNFYWRKERLLIGKPDKGGYISHTIKSISSFKATWLAHRLIAIAWIPNPDNKPFINHKDGIKTNNHVENLEWCSKSENGIHAVTTGLHTPLRGEQNGNHKLTKEQVLEIRKADGTQLEIATKFNIGRTTVQYIMKRKLWAHLN